MGSKKVLIIDRGNEIGGGVIYLKSLIKLLHKEYGFQIHMTYTSDKFKRIFQEEFPFIRFHRVVINRAINPVKDLISLIKLIQLMRRENYYIVHTNTSKGGFLGRLSAKISKIPIVLHTIHGFAFHEYSFIAAKVLYILLERIAAKWSTKIITVNDYHLELALKYKICERDKIVAIPNGINENRVQPTKPRIEIRNELGVKDEILITSIGRLAKQKGFEYLVEAIKILETIVGNKNYKLIIVGEGPLRKKLREKLKITI